MVAKRMRKFYSVYKLTFPNGKVYIGMTSQKPEQRWARGSGYTKKKPNGEYVQPDLVAAIFECGWDAIKKEIIIDGLTKAQAEYNEKKYIRLHKSTNPEYGYNIDSGGKPKGTATKKIVCVDTGVAYKSSRDAERRTGVDQSSIIKCCKGKLKTAGKMDWMYYNDWKEYIAENQT